MKIIRLSLNNLASLAGTHHIHFEENPLAQAGLIAITGKTGAGKSTLLDAMCLALYDGIPRLPDSDNPRSRRKSTIVDASGQAISINDPKNILRRGTTSGFSELEFIALDQKRYIARWEIKRSRNKVDGNIKVDRHVTCVDDGRVMTQKITECTPFIEKITGLTFKQFTRAVLLAQSEIGAFLKADDDERAALLEYLTDSKIFSEVSKRAAEKHSEVTRKRNELESYIGNLELLSEEQLALLDAQSTQLKSKIDHITTQEKLLENDLKWHQTRHELYAETQAKKEVYLVQLDADQHMQAQKQQLHYIDVFQPIRDTFKRHADATQHIENLNHKISAFLPEIQEIEQQHQQALLQQQQAESHHQDWQMHLAQLKPVLAQAQQLDQAIQTQLQLHSSHKKQLDDLTNQEIAPLEQSLAEKRKHLAQQQDIQQHTSQQLLDTSDWAVFDEIIPSTLQQLKQYQQQADKLQQQSAHGLNATPENILQDIAQLKQQQAKWQAEHQDIASLEKNLHNQQQTIDVLTQQLYQLDQLKQNLVRWQNDHQLLQQYSNNRDDLTLQLKALQQQQTQQQKIADDALYEFKNLQKVFDQQRLLQNQSVQTLREQLRPDEPCMVCGSHQHPFITHAELLEQSLKAVQDQQLLDAEKLVQDSQQQLQNTVIAISQHQANLQQTQQNLQSLDSHLQTQIVQLKTLMQSADIHLDLNANSSALQSTLDEQIKAKQASLNTSKQTIQQLQSVLSEWRNTEQKYAQLMMLQQQLEQMQLLIAPIHAALNNKHQQQLQTDPQQFCDDAIQALNTRSLQLQQHQSQSKQIETCMQEIQQIETRLQYLKDKHSQLNTTLNEVIQTGKSLRHELDQLTQDHAGQVYKKYADWQEALNLQTQQSQQQLDQYRVSVQNLDKALQQKRITQQDLLSQQTQWQSVINITEQDINTWKLNHTEYTQELITQCLSIDHQTHQNMRLSIEKQQEALNNAKTAWQTLEEHYQKHLKLEPQFSFEQVQQQLATLHEEKSTHQHQFNELDALIRVNKSKQETYQKYQDQITAVKAEEYRWGRIYDLIGHKEGTKFKKIAQEHHLDILVEYANQQLQPLSPRYQLHRIPESLGLAIIDLDMNNEMRPVLSLSGGETFLVSLALALAIANMASGSMKLESLFIDEGFGTLDPSSLHMVMNALDRLQSQGRKVILISHIQEMHERIPVQIQVQPQGNGSSQIKIVG